MEELMQEDILRLPCKIHSTNERYSNFQIVWRSNGGLIRTKEFDDEFEADVFLEGLLKNVNLR